jgi:hypothetical protein
MYASLPELNIWSDKKQNEKIDHIRNNPMAHGLVPHPGDWPRLKAYDDFLSRAVEPRTTSWVGSRTFSQ